MSQLSISIFTSYFRIFIIFVILIICINNDHVSANGIDDDDDGLIHPINLDESFYFKNSLPENIELTRRGVWSRLFRSETNSPQKMNSHSHHSSTAPVYALTNGRLHLIPHDKRTIPIELRKALYAHGIVGRRR